MVSGEKIKLCLEASMKFILYDCKMRFIKTRYFDYCKRFGLFQGTRLYWLTKLSTGKIEFKMPGLHAPLVMRIGTSDRPTFEKIFLYAEYDVELSCKPKFIIDAGANVGYASVLFAHRYPDAQIIAVEPDDENFSLLQHNTVAYPNVTIMKCGVWSRDTYLKIENPLAQPWAYRVVETDSSVDAFLSVTLTSLLGKAKANRIDLLKIDVEGSELQIFGAADCANWLDRTDVILIELHENLQPGCEKVFHRAIESQSFHKTKVGENIVLSRETKLLSTSETFI